MMRLPRFKFLSPSTVSEAAKILRDEGPTAMVVAGGTDLYPNMKRRHQMPKTVISLNRIAELRGVEKKGRGLRLGPTETLTALERNRTLSTAYPALQKAIHSISTPILRNMGTLGGNVCLDTRCNYYNQNYEWRRAINFCMKCEGRICWVAPSSKICLAVNSSDTAPVLCAMGATLRLQSTKGKRAVNARDFYKRDGITYLNKRPDEILTSIDLPSPAGMRATYWKLRRREAFDFPVLGVAACLWFKGKVVDDAKIYLGAVASSPLEAVEAQQEIIGKPLTAESIARAADRAFATAKPMDNTDFHLHWRKEMTRQYVKGALAELQTKS